MPPAPQRPSRHRPAGSPGQPLDVLAVGLLACGRGDESAFAALYDGVAPRIYGLVLRIVGDAGHAEEVTHRVLVEIWRAAGGFDPSRGSAQSWVMATAHRRAVEAVRDPAAGARRVTADLDAATAGGFPDAVSSSEVAVDARRLATALGTLTDSQRRAVELSYFAGCTSRHVARLAEMSVETATACIRDGLVRLRDGLVPAPQQRA